MATEKNKSEQKSLIASRTVGSRGSAKTVTPKKRKKGEPTVAVFIDLDNTGASVSNLEEIFANLERKGKIIYGKLYGYTDEKSIEFEQIVAEHNLETVGRARSRTEDVSVIDTRLVVDCMGFSGRRGASSIFVWAGIGDMIPVFSNIAASGCNTITVDLPEFDCNNKYVQEKIRLFSPHSLKKAARSASTRSTVELENEEKESSEPISIAAELGLKIPSLPRKKGAPEFGALPEAAKKLFGAVEDDDDDTDLDLEDEEVFDEDFNLDDEDGDDEVQEIDDGRKDLDFLENAKLLELTENMLYNLQSGKSIDSINLDKMYQEVTAKVEGKKEPEKTKVIAKTEKKAASETSKKTKTLKYEPEEEIEKNEEKKSYADSKNDFNDFGDL